MPTLADHSERLPVWSHLALFASLSTAVEVSSAIRDRRRGRDASAQEADSEAFSYLSTALPALRIQLIRLRVQVGVGLNGADGASSVLRRFPELLMLLNCARMMHRIHQRLLSLYPGVSAERIEEVRLLETDAAELLQGRSPGWHTSLGSWVERALESVHGLSAEVS